MARTREQAASPPLEVATGARTASCALTARWLPCRCGPPMRPAMARCRTRRGCRRRRSCMVLPAAGSALGLWYGPCSTVARGTILSLAPHCTIPPPRGHGWQDDRASHTGGACEGEPPVREVRPEGGLDLVGEREISRLPVSGPPTYRQIAEIPVGRMERNMQFDGRAWNDEAGGAGVMSPSKDRPASMRLRAALALGPEICACSTGSRRTGCSRRSNEVRRATEGMTMGIIRIGPVAGGSGAGGMP